MGYALKLHSNSLTMYCGEPDSGYVGVTIFQTEEIICSISMLGAQIA
jgi:hypothetical protein